MVLDTVEVLDSVVVLAAVVVSAVDVASAAAVAGEIVITLPVNRAGYGTINRMTTPPWHRRD